MSEVKHTPGPWKILRKRPMEMSGNFHQVTDNERYPAAFVPAWDNPAVGEIDGTEEALANARLIAAAPEMLEALKEQERADRLLEDGEDVAAMLSYADAKSIRSKAIAKAEGRDQ